MKRVVFIVGVVMIAAAFVAGYWPQHQRAVDAESAANAARRELSDADRNLRLSELLGQLLQLSDAIDARNYGEAAMLATTYFDRVRTDAAQEQRPGVRQALEQVLQTRDGVTAALARSDASVGATLRQQELILRRALGYPVPAA